MLVERKEIRNEDNSIGYIEAVYNSGNILKTIYFIAQNRLYISFKRGGTYSYDNITSEMYGDFETAESQGKYFHKVISANPSKYPYRHEFNLMKLEIEEIINLIESKEDEND